MDSILATKIAEQSKECRFTVNYHTYTCTAPLRSNLNKSVLNKVVGN